MAERFIKFIPSESAMKFAIKYKNAFILLLVIAESARRTNGSPDGLTVGQCHLGNHKNYGMTEKEYRYAKQVLVDQGLIKIVVTNRTRKKGKQTQKLFEQANGATERATEPTTTGTLVELCNSDVWDINSDASNQQKGDRNGDPGATEGRLKGDKQEGIRKKKKEKEVLPQTPSDPIPSKIKFRELVELTQPEHDKLLILHGKDLLDVMLNMLNSYKGRKGVKYDSDYYAMDQGSWVVREAKKDLENQKTPKDEKHFRSPQATPPGNTPGSSTKFEGNRVLRGSNSVEGDEGTSHG